MTRTMQQCPSLIAAADEAFARGDVRQAASLLEVAAQRGRNSTTLLRLAAVRRSLGDLGGALNAATAAVELSPRNFVSCLLLGSLREAMGALHGAQRAYRTACAHAPVDLSFQPAMERQFEWARQRAEALEEWHKRLLEWQPRDVGSDLTKDEEQRLRGFRTNLLENFNSGPVAPPVFMVPGIRRRNISILFDFLARANWSNRRMRSGTNFLPLQKGRPKRFHRSCRASTRLRPTPRALVPGPIPLIRNGAIVEEFASRCPRTMEAVKKLDFPKLSLVSPTLCFSILEPNSRITPHSGITNARMIAHLPLIVPENCALRVGGEVREWETGKLMAFDDMTVHEAWNDSDRLRVVLIADLWRPELSQAERLGFTQLMHCRDVGHEI